MKAYLNGEESQGKVASLRDENNRKARALVEAFLAKHGANLQTLERQA
jgi:hypothetical protein